MFILAAKLRALKALLKAWNFSSFGDVHLQVSISKAALDLVQAEISDLGPSVDRFQWEEVAHSAFQLALSSQGSLLHSKSRIRWLSEGDRNTSFLHNMVKIRKLHRPLVSLRVGSIVLHDNDLISAQVVQHFKQAFTQDTSISNTGLVEKIIPHLVTNDENLMLLALPSVEEITTTVKSMDAYSSPGPDGFGGIFFHHCWDVISTDVINAVQSFFRKCSSGNIAIKLDISKAFDTLDWGFLLRVLRAFGFDLAFTNWLHCILNSAYISVSINGSSCGFFSCSRGVRQGDPLSPLLFCLAEEVLSRGISQLVAKGKIDTIAAPKKVTVPSHVLFADDIMIFMQGNSQSLRALNRFLNAYAKNSGQVVNKAKSSIFLGRYARPRETIIQHTLGIREGSLPCTYLGVPIFIGRPKSVYFRSIADKVRCKLSSWKGHQLSQAARLQLISSVIQSLLIYSFQVYKWPRALLLRVQGWTRNFFWSGDPLKKGSTLVFLESLLHP
ncbi:hypothetical protein M0R45_004967 [Rubus argutus]|uniref:Reverse transcriptase domain-containing protein n=1 Tax=Rubus argutus TaxID=59490 RepID=A0AAW1YLU7_RUBAR